MSDEWRCPICFLVVKGRFSIACHRRNLYRKVNDPHRCDNYLANVRKTALEADEILGWTDDVGSPIRVQRTSDAVVQHSAAAVVTDEVVQHSAAAVVTGRVTDVVDPPGPTPLTELARRPVGNNVVQSHERRTTYKLQRSPIPPHIRPRNMFAMQSLWQDHVVRTRECASEQFWSYFLHLHTQPAVVIDSALRAAKKTFMAEQKGSLAWKSFPQKISKLMSQVPTDFWQNVTHTVSIDVSHLQLPKPLSSLTFKFIDPSFAWIIAARRQDPCELHWKPVLRTDDNGAPLYGAGVQHGRLFAEACRSCPQGSYPMPFSLHWDGTEAFGVSAAPICVGVANTNSGAVDCSLTVVHTSSFYR